MLPLENFIKTKNKKVQNELRDQTKTHARKKQPPKSLTKPKLREI